MSGGFANAGLPSGFSEAVDLVRVPVAIADERSCITQLNQAFVEAFGANRPEDVRGKSLFDLLAHPSVVASVRTRLGSEGAWHGDVFVQRLDGTRRALSLAIGMRPGRGDAAGFLLIVANDRSLTQVLLDRFSASRTIFDDGPVVAFSWNLETENAIVTRFVSANVTRLGLTSEEVLGRNFNELVHPDDLPRVRAANEAAIAALARDPAAPDFVEYEYRIVRRDGTALWVHDYTKGLFLDGRLVGAYGYLTDIDAAKKNEELLLRTQRLDSLGLLAAGVAHDFNNILTAVLGNVQLAQDAVGPSPAAAPFFAGATQALARARGLTAQLLALGKVSGGRVESVDLRRLVAEVCQLHLSGSRVRVLLDAEDDLWSCRADSGQIAQVIANIVINARQAMENGHLWIDLRNEVLSCGAIPSLPSGQYVRVAFSDEGPGIAPEHLGRIFDPFFTTKKQGSGLGLATADAITRKHGGAIEVQSPLTDAGGARFVVHLPAETATRAILREAQGSVARVSPLRLLVMDDDVDARRAVEAMLRHRGHTVNGCGSGEEALRLVAGATDAASFDVAVLDLTVPGGQGGADVARELRRLAPRMALLACSGYSNTGVMQAPRAYGFDGALEKPFGMDALEAAITEALMVSAKQTE